MPHLVHHGGEPELQDAEAAGPDVPVVRKQREREMDASNVACFLLLFSQPRNDGGLPL